jgi:putative flippase GtrA
LPAWVLRRRYYRSFVSLAGLGRITAYALTIPAVTLAMFTANRGWTFRSRRQASIESRTS